MSNLGSVSGSIRLDVSSLRRAAKTVADSFKQIQDSYNALSATAQAASTRINQALSALGSNPGGITRVNLELRTLDQQFAQTAQAAQQAGRQVAVGTQQFTRAGPQAQSAVGGVKALETGLRSLGGVAGTVAAQVTSAGRQIQQAGQNMAATGGILTAAISVPLAAVGGSAIQMAAEFQRSQNVLQATTGATEAQMAALRAEAIALGSDISLPGTSAADAATAMLELAKAGVSVEDTIAASRGVLQLSAAAQTDNATAARLTAAALNTFGLSGDQATVVADQLAAAANASSANITDLGDGLAQAGFAFASLTGDIYPAEQAVLDLNTVLAALTKSGLSGSDGATAVKNAIIKLQAPTEAGAAKLRELGIATTDAQGRFLPFQQLLANVEAGLRGLTPAQQATALNTIFLADGMKAIIPLLSLGTEGFAALQSQIGQAGVASRQAAAINSGLLGALDGLKSTLETVGLTLAEPFLGPLENAVLAVAGLVDRITELNPAITNGVLAFAAVAAAAGPLLLVIGGLGTAFGFLLSPVGALVAIIAALAAAFASGVVQLSIFNPVLDQLARLASIVGGVLVGLIGPARSWGSGLVNAFADGMAAAVGAVASALAVIGDMVSYWLTPGSPPPLLPDLDTWGTEAAQVYLDGWGKADLSALDTLGRGIESMIRSAGAAAGDSDQDILSRVVGSEAAITAAITELREAGSVSESTFAAIREAAGPAGEAAERLARAYIATLEASQRLNEAQRDQRAAGTAVAQAQVALAQAIAGGNPQLIAERRAALAAAQAKQREAAQRVAAAKQAQEAAQGQLEQQEALNKANERQNQLLAEQRRLEGQQQRGGGGGGGGKAPKAEGLTEEERAAQRAAAAQREYELSVASSEEKLARLREELAATTEGSEEYYRKLGEVSRAEQQVQREQEARVAEQEREAKALADAQFAYQLATSDTAGKLDLLRQKQQGLSADSAEYYQVAQQIAGLEDQQRREAEKAAKESGSGRAAGGGGGGGGGGALGALAGEITSPFAAIGESVTQVRETFDKAAEAAKGALDRIGRAAEMPKQAIDRIGGAVNGLPQFFTQVIPQAIAGLLGAVPGLIATGQQLLLGLLEGLRQQLPGILGFMGEVGANVIGAVGGQLPGIIGALKAWSFAFLNWIVEAGPEMLTTFAIFVGTLLTAIAQQIPGIVSALAQWGAELFQWIVTSAPQMQAQFLALVSQFYGWIAAQVPGIASTLGQWIIAFISWVGPAAAQLILTLGILYGEFLGWLIDQIPGIVSTLAQWVPAFISWVVVALDELLKALGTVISGIETYLGGQVDLIVRSAAGIGKAIVDGIRNGINAGWDALLRFVAQKANDLLGAAMKAIGAASPSKRFRDEFGRSIPQGAELGIDAESDRPLNAVQRMARSLLNVRIPLPTIDSTSAVASILAAQRALPLAAGASIAASAVGSSATAAPQGGGDTYIESIPITVTTPAIASIVDGRRLGKEIAEEFRYQMKKRGV
jgi:TP901 family phage tail tape measure protein